LNFAPQLARLLGLHLRNLGLHLRGLLGVISAVNHFYGHDGVELGAYKGILGTDEVCSICRGPFVDDVIASSPGPVKNYSQVPEGHVLYRKVLASQPDASVVIAAHGFLVNLQHLLNSTADEYSELNGVELVRKKVKQIAIMACASLFLAN
jgi:hypothetical protein